MARQPFTVCEPVPPSGGVAPAVDLTAQLQPFVVARKVTVEQPARAGQMQKSRALCRRGIEFSIAMAGMASGIGSARGKPRGAGPGIGLTQDLGQPGGT